MVSGLDCRGTVDSMEEACGRLTSCPAEDYLINYV